MTTDSQIKSNRARIEAQCKQIAKNHESQFRKYDYYSDFYEVIQEDIAYANALQAKLDALTEYLQKNNQQRGHNSLRQKIDTCGYRVEFFKTLHELRIAQNVVADKSKHFYEEFVPNHKHALLDAINYFGSVYIQMIDIANEPTDFGSKAYLLLAEYNDFFAEIKPRLIEFLEAHKFIDKPLPSNTDALALINEMINVAKEQATEETVLDAEPIVLHFFSVQAHFLRNFRRVLQISKHEKEKAKTQNI